MAISPPSNRRIGSPSGVRSGASPPQALPPAGSGTSSACGAWRSRRRPRSKRICSSTPPITASKPPPSPSQKPGSAWPRAMPPPRTQKNSACCRRYGTLPRQRSMAHSAPSSSAQPSATSGNGRRTPRATSTAIQAISPRPSSNKRPSGLSDIRSSMIHPTFLAKARVIKAPANHQSHRAALSFSYLKTPGRQGCPHSDWNSIQVSSRHLGVLDDRL